MPQRRLTKEKVIQVALELVDQKGFENLSIQDLARTLEIKAPSLYNHIRSLEELQHLTGEQAAQRLTTMIETEVQGKEGSQAVFALAKTYRQFALAHPGLYQISVVFPRQNANLPPSTINMRELFAKILRTQFPSLPEENIRAAARALRSLLHGFVAMEITNGWTNIIDKDKSFEQALDFLIAGIEARAAQR